MRMREKRDKEDEGKEIKRMRGKKDTEDEGKRDKEDEGEKGINGTRRKSR